MIQVPNGPTTALQLGARAPSSPLPTLRDSPISSMAAQPLVLGGLAAQMESGPPADASLKPDARQWPAGSCFKAHTALTTSTFPSLLHSGIRMAAHNVTALCAGPDLSFP